MAEDNDDEFDENGEPELPSEAEQDAMLDQIMTQLPPNLHEILRPMLLLATVANYMLVGYADDPVPAALRELLGYDASTVDIIVKATDNRSLARVMSFHALKLFDVVFIGRLVFESPLDEPLRAYLGRNSGGAEGYIETRNYFLHHSENLLENLSQYLTSGNDEQREELGEELRMRRLQTESVFARLADTLRPFYPPGQSPADEQAAALDEDDEAEDNEAAAAHITFNEGQRMTLAMMLRLTHIMGELAETPFAAALPQVERFRKKALERLATRLAEGPNDEPMPLAWSEVLRLYQVAQVGGLSTVADVMAAGSLQDVMANVAPDPDEEDAALSPEERIEQAHRLREMLVLVMSGFVDLIERHYPDDDDVLDAKAEISQLAELLV